MDQDSTQFADEVAGSCACFKARQAARQITRAYDAALRPLDLRVTQFTVLAAVTKVDGKMTLTDLAKAMGMERSTLSRNLGPLERRGLVALSPEGYRRGRTVEITADGRRLFARAMPLWRTAQNRLKDALGARAWQDFNQQMRVISSKL